MKVTCSACDKAVAEPGGLLFSPPFKNNKDSSIFAVHKYHICVDCWPALVRRLDSLADTSKAKGKA